MRGMTVRTGSSPIERQGRQAIKDGALVACDLAEKDERIALLCDESSDEVFEGWTFALGLVDQQADQRAQQLEALAGLLSDDGEV
jgi:hypothetical protein